MDQKEFNELFRKYTAGALSEAEQRRLEAWYNHHAGTGGAFPSHEELESRLHSIGRKLPLARPHAHTRRVSRWLPYAAAALLVTSAVGYFAVVNRQSMVDSPDIPDIAPGGNRATLTLADGRTIDLSSEQAGIIVTEGITYLDGSAVFGEQVNRGASEQVSVGASEQVQGSERNSKFTSSQVHSLTTPKGGTYQITLPDGTKVWLNAASTLKYPSRFDGNERVVELAGEAYFDVNEQAHRLTSSLAHKLTNSQKIPFKVITNGQTVEVLGTEFNISAYADEPETKTTLVEGKVKVSSSDGQAGLTTHDSRLTTHDSRLTTYDSRLTTYDSRLTTNSSVLTPGQQATTRGARTEVVRVNLETAVAWKDGRFSFDGKPFTRVMAELSRWYDLEVVYDGQVPKQRFFGDVYRDENLSVVLKMLQSANIDYELSGNQLTIRSKE